MDGEVPAPAAAAAQRKGRFTVIENESRPLVKTPSGANIQEGAGKPGTKSEPGLGLGVANHLGKPPVGPSSMGTPQPSSSMQLRLQELLDHATSHQLAVQVCVEGVGAWEGGYSRCVGGGEQQVCV